jgi:hypothetical protein
MEPIYAGQLDAQLQLLAAATQTASTNGTALVLSSDAYASQFAPGQGGIPALAIIFITAVKLTAGNETYAFKVQDSPDGTTWYDRSPTTTVTQEGMPDDGTAGAFVLGAFIRNVNVRLVTTLGGTSPSITLGACYLSFQANMTR